MRVPHLVAAALFAVTTMLGAPATAAGTPLSCSYTALNDPIAADTWYVELDGYWVTEDTNPLLPYVTLHCWLQFDGPNLAHPAATDRNPHCDFAGNGVAAGACTSVYSGPVGEIWVCTWAQVQLSSGIANYYVDADSSAPGVQCAGALPV